MTGTDGTIDTTSSTDHSVAITTVSGMTRGSEREKSSMIAMGRQGVISGEWAFELSYVLWLASWPGV